MKKKIIIVIALILALSMLFAIFCSNNKQPKEKNGVEWNGKRQTSDSTETKMIALPGFNELTFHSGAKTQKVNLYNPSKNDCIMSMEIATNDGVVIWHEDNIYPGYGFYEIEPQTQLSIGEYKKCKLNIRCFTEEGTELNGCTIRFTLKII